MAANREKLYGERLSRIIQKETISVSGKPFDKKFLEFHKLLDQLFPHVFKTCEKQMFGASFLLRWPGKKKDRPVLLMSHHDVVDAQGQWTYPPFSGTIADGKLWGRGTLDTKGSLFCMLQAMEELMESGFVPEQDVWFESACTEEIDGSGALAAATWLKENNIHFVFSLDEGGMIVKDPLGMTDNMYAVVGVGEKTFVDLKFHAKSHGGHASSPSKNTPLVRLGKFMAEMDRSNCFKARLNPAISEMLRRISEDMNGGLLKFALKNAGKFPVLFGNVLKFVSAQAAALVRSTLAFTMAEGSEGTNVLPQEAWVIGNLRVSHHEGLQKNMNSIRKIADKYQIEVEIIEEQPESPLSDYHAEGFQLLEQTTSELFKGLRCVPYVSSTASDSRFFGEVSDCCLRFEPFIISDQQLDSIHGLDENIDLDNLPRAVDFYRTLIKGVH